MRLVHLTDLHLVRPGTPLFGLDPLARLEAALAHIGRHEAGAEILLITGDLTDRGEPEAYAALAERLAPWRARTALLLGNHDDRDAFKTCFGGVGVDEAGFVQGVVDGDDGVSLVTLDTLVPGAGHGTLCDRRLDWLEARLAERAGRAVYLAMHHPPLASGIPGMDATGLDAADAFWRLMTGSPHVRHVFAGHIHRPFFARRGHVTVSTLPGSAHQVHLQFEAEDAVLGSLEPGAYGIADLGVDGFGVHLCAFTDASPRFLFDDISNRARTAEALPPVPPPYDRLV